MYVGNVEMYSYTFGFLKCERMFCLCMAVERGSVIERERRRNGKVGYSA